jgi:3-hydroxyacyl-[acyl-carrier-protein] dehydratase
MTDLNIEQIKSLIPHRYPFLLIDKLIDIIPNESATGIKNVTFNENYFQGHFDSISVMPGALIIESMAQSAGTLVMHSLKKTQNNMSVYLLTKQNIKNIWKFSCKSYVDDNLVAQAEVSAILNSE